MVSMEINDNVCQYNMVSMEINDNVCQYRVNE